MFGPILIRERRSDLKRYAALFTSFFSRAVHIEITNTIDADSFIMALRRFLARRGSVRSIWSGNGTNFVGANNEFQKALKEMDHLKIKNYLQGNGTDWILCQTLSDINSQIPLSPSNLLTMKTNVVILDLVFSRNQVYITEEVGYVCSI